MLVAAYGVRLRTSGQLASGAPDTLWTHRGTLHSPRGRVELLLAWRALSSGRPSFTAPGQNTAEGVLSLLSEVSPSASAGAWSASRVIKRTASSSHPDHGCRRRRDPLRWIFSRAGVALCSLGTAQHCFGSLGVRRGGRATGCGLLRDGRGLFGASVQLAGRLDDLGLVVKAAARSLLGQCIGSTRVWVDRSQNLALLPTRPLCGRDCFCNADADANGHRAACTDLRNDHAKRSTPAMGPSALVSRERTARRRTLSKN